MEHIPHQVMKSDGSGFEPMDGLITVMNEAWRVLKPGGRMENVVPHASTPGALQDPTHQRYFVEQSWWYFGRPEHYVPDVGTYTAGPEWDWHWYGSDYGIKARFDIILNECADGSNLRCILRKPEDS